jgi:hypothetical protein
MTLQLRHLSSLLLRKPLEAPKAPPRSDVPGLAYYTAADRPERPDAAKLCPEEQALEAMYGYYSA